MGQETPNLSADFSRHVKKSCLFQSAQFPPRSAREIGTAPVAVTISLRATTAAGNAAQPETPGELSINCPWPRGPGMA